jgi:hypothetical protein
MTDQIFWSKLVLVIEYLTHVHIYGYMQYDYFLPIN